MTADDNIAFVLLSGGIDSAVCLAMAKQQHQLVCPVTIDYGQRHRREIGFAAMLAQHFGLSHGILALHNVIPRTPLTDIEAAIPDMTYEEIKGISPVYVPFRNGLFLSAITSFATGIYPSEHQRLVIYFGGHAEDALHWAYPDCTPEFIGAMANAIHVGSYRRARLQAPLMHLVKADIIKKGMDYGVPFELTWSCYEGGELHCGRCPTCYARRRAFFKAGVPDLTVYRDFVET